MEPQVPYPGAGVCFESLAVITPGFDLSSMLGAVPSNTNPPVMGLRLNRSLSCGASGQTLLAEVLGLLALPTGWTYRPSAKR